MACRGALRRTQRSPGQHRLHLACPSPEAVAAVLRRREWPATPTLPQLCSLPRTRPNTIAKSPALTSPRPGRSTGSLRPPPSGSFSGPTRRTTNPMGMLSQMIQCLAACPRRHHRVGEGVLIRPRIIAGMPSRTNPLTSLAWSRIASVSLGSLDVSVTLTPSGVMLSCRR